MASWTFEPGHTAAEFCVRHMMVSLVRGHFKDVHGTLQFDPENPRASAVEVHIDARKLWSGEAQRDKHLKSADFLDVERYPAITFRGRGVELAGKHEFTVPGDLTIRGVTKKVSLQVWYLGQWETPWWENGVDKGPKSRAGFVARTRIDRQEFGVKWNASLKEGGVVVGDSIDITIDAEAIKVS
jgi:polyisoprenoid-binding protein YceI